MIVNKYKYGGGGSGSGVTPQEVQAQIDSALTPYWDSAATESAITQSVSGKADSANLSFEDTNPVDLWFPKWNEQGIITGKTGLRNFQIRFDINGMRNTVTSPDNSHIPSIYAPNTSGNPGEILVSTGHGAPVWSAVTMPDVSGFYTSAQTDEKIASAVTPVANHLAEVEEITASAYTELHDDILALSARTPDMSAYTPTSGFSTINGSAITNGGNIVIQGGGGDMSGYWNSAETKSYVDSAATNLQDQIDTMDDVVAAALVDLNDRVDAISAATQDMVTSTDVRHIVKLTQAAYDQLVLDDEVDPYTFYIIVNSN